MVSHHIDVDSSRWIILLISWIVNNKLVIPCLIEPATIRSPDLLEAQLSARLLRAGIHGLEVDKDALLLTVRRVLSHLILRGSNRDMGFGKLQFGFGLI